uniref:Uncharacterized protein n=1 Tax=Cacopsylla melanoneura TaxID=428564 RepID=A0A8D8RFB4_9HEMI
MNISFMQISNLISLCIIISSKESCDLLTCCFMRITESRPMLNNCSQRTGVFDVRAVFRGGLAPFRTSYLNAGSLGGFRGGAFKPPLLPILTLSYYPSEILRLYYPGEVTFLFSFELKHPP